MLKYTFHQLPFLITPGISSTALELADVGFPLRLTGKGGKEGHVAGKIEVILGVHNHKETPTFSIYLHIEDANLALASDYLWPHVSVSVHVLLNHLLVINERQSLTVAFHFGSRLTSLTLLTLGIENKFSLLSLNRKVQDSGFKIYIPALLIVRAKASLFSLQNLSASSTTQAK